MEITDPEFDQGKFNAYVKMLYKFFPTGGPFHIVLDDQNVETQHIVFCLMEYGEYQYEFNRPTVEIAWLKVHRHDMLEMATMLLDLNEDDRFTAIERALKAISS